MADEKTGTSEDAVQKAVEKLNKAEEKVEKGQQRGQKSNEITERDKVKDKDYVQRIEEKTKKH